MNASLLAGHLRYTAWATRRMLDSVRPLSLEEYARDLHTSFGGIRGTLLHLLGADRIWLARLQAAAPPAFPTPAELPTFDALDPEWRALLDRLEAWGNALGDVDAARVVAYRTTKGEPFETPVWQIVLHLVNHGTYHRGQVAAMLRQLGKAPANTDLIAYYRSSRG